VTPSFADLVVQMVVEGGPYALGVLGWLAWWYERRQNKENGDRLFGLATAQVETTVRHEGAIKSISKLMEHFLNR